MTADQIIRLLAEKHAKDVFVSECKDGKSYGGHIRMDAWAMDRSWAHPCMHGYEVKITRADFLGDNKWPGYLSLCNRFSFVAPKGVIQTSELSEGVGLFEVASTGNCLRTIRKPAWREIEPPAELLKYILMCRAKICPTRFNRVDDEDQALFWRQWMDRKKGLEEVGHLVSKRLRRIISERITEVECENKRLAAENQSYAEIAALLKELNLSPSVWGTERRIRDLASEFRSGVPKKAVAAIQAARDALDVLMPHIANPNRDLTDAQDSPARDGVRSE